MSCSHHRHSLVMHINSCSWEHKRSWLSYHKRQFKFLCTTEVACWELDKGWSRKTRTVLSGFLSQKFKNMFSNKFTLKYVQNVDLNNMNVWTGKRQSLQTSVKQVRIYLSICASIWFLKFKPLMQIGVTSGSFTCFWQSRKLCSFLKIMFNA